MNYLLNMDNNKIIVEKSIYLEPVCFLASLGKTNELAYNEKYIWEYKKNFYDNIRKLYVYYFLTRDIYFQALVKRYMPATDLYEYFIEMNTEKLIIVGERDSIICADDLKIFCQKNWKCKFLYYENEYHGFILKPFYKDKIKKIITEFIVK